MWDSLLYIPLNSYNILLRLTDFDNLPREGSKQLIEAAGELKTSTDPESTMQCTYNAILTNMLCGMVHFTST